MNDAVDRTESRPRLLDGLQDVLGFADVALEVQGLAAEFLERLERGFDFLTARRTAQQHQTRREASGQMSGQEASESTETARDHIDAPLSERRCRCLLDLQGLEDPHLAPPVQPADLQVLGRPVPLRQ